MHYNTFRITNAVAYSLGLVFLKLHANVPALLAHSGAY